MKKKVLFAGLIVVLILFLVKGIRIQSVDEYYMTHMEDIGPDSETVTLSINCSTVREEQNWRKLSRQLQDEKYVPKDGAGSFRRLPLSCGKAIRSMMF